MCTWFLLVFRLLSAMSFGDAVTPFLTILRMEKGGFCWLVKKAYCRPIVGNKEAWSASLREVSIRRSKIRQFTCTRGHSYKFYKPRSDCSVKMNLFANRVINAWNNLSVSLVYPFFRRTIIIRSVDFINL